MRFRTVLSPLALAAACAIAMPESSAAQTFYSTAAGPIGLADPNWSVAGIHGGFGAGFAGFGGAFGTAYHYADYGTLPMLSNNPAGSNGGIGAYMFFTFRQYFDLTGYDATTADLKFRWGCDDVPSTGAVPWVPVFSLNGAATQGAGTCGNYALGGVVDLNSGFVAGMNYLDFYVEGNGQTDGLGLSTESFTAAPSSAVPEPASVALLATGLLGIGLVARRRKA